MPSAKKPAPAGKRSAKPATGRRTAAPAKKAAARPVSPKAAHAESVRAEAAQLAAGRPAARQEARSRATGPMITIEQYDSGIGCPVRHKRILRSLGLRHPRQRVVRPDNPAVRGMVKAVTHLVRVVTEDSRGA